MSSQDAFLPQNLSRTAMNPQWTAPVGPAVMMPFTPVQRTNPSFDSPSSRQIGDTSFACHYGPHLTPSHPLSFGPAFAQRGPMQDMGVPTSQDQSKKALPREDTISQGQPSSSPTHPYGISFGQHSPSISVRPIVLPTSEPKHSRLPPKYVVRKAPRKSTNSAAQPARPCPRVVKQPSSPGSARCHITQDGTPPATRDSESSDEKDDIPLALKRPRLVSMGCGEQPEILNFMQTCEVDVSFEQSPKASGPPPKPRDGATIAKLIRGTFPQSYHVPPELEGVRQALGESGWNEYIGMVEKLLLEELTREKFDTVTRRAFQVGSAKVRMRIEDMVAEMMVGSALEIDEIGDGFENWED